MTTAGGGHRKRKTVKRGLEDFCGARPELFVRTGKGWECSGGAGRGGGGAVRPVAGERRDVTGRRAASAARSRGVRPGFRGRSVPVHMSRRARHAMHAFV